MNSATYFIFKRKAGILTVFFFLASLWLYTRHNQHPYYYETDGPSKVEQILSGERNFNHPLLLLASTDLFMTVLGKPHSEQSAMVAGRWMSAIFAALSVAVLSCLAGRIGGGIAAFCSGLLLLTTQLLFDRAHYMKEDTALLFGLSLTLLAASIFWQKRTRWSVLALGAACAVAVSAKYVGIIAVVIALPLLLIPPPCSDRDSRPIRLALFMAAFLGLFTIINIEMLFHIHTFQNSLSVETKKLFSPRKLKDIPHVDRVINLYEEDFSLPVLALILFQMGFVVFARRKKEPLDWLLAFLPLAYTIVLMFIPKIFPRYFVPVFALQALVAGLGIANLAAFFFPQERFTAWTRALFALLCLTGALAFQVPRLLPLYHGMASDNRRSLLEWIAKNLPENAIIAQDKRAYLPDSSGKFELTGHLRQKVITADMVADLGPVAILRNAGITHVVLYDTDSRKFLRGGSQAPKSWTKPVVFKNHVIVPGFFDELEDHGKLLWIAHPGPSDNLQPGLRLYELPASAQR